MLYSKENHQLYENQRGGGRYEKNVRNPNYQNRTSVTLKKQNLSSEWWWWWMMMNDDDDEANFGSSIRMKLLYVIGGVLT